MGDGDEGQNNTNDGIITVLITKSGILKIPPQVVKEVSQLTEAKIGGKIKYRVTRYRYDFPPLIANGIAFIAPRLTFLLNQEVRDRVKWKIKIGGNPEELTVTGEEIEIEIEVKNEWAGKDILVMPYLISPLESVSAKTWCYILDHQILKNDFGLNRIAAGEQVNLDADSVKTACTALNKLVDPVDRGELLGQPGSIDGAGIKPRIKLFQNEYMDLCAGDIQYEELCGGNIDRETILAMNRALHEGWKIRWKHIGEYTNGGKMTVRAFGNGRLKAALLIGGLHADEKGGMRAIKIMKDRLKQKRDSIPSDTAFFVLNPANNNFKSRLAGGYDANRAFFLEESKKPKEIKAIANFIRELAARFNHFTIISAHSGDDFKEERPRGEGVVFPLYRLTEAGHKKVEEAVRSNPHYHSVGINMINTKEIKYYTNPAASVRLMEIFVECTGFLTRELWDDEVYHGELINFVSHDIPKEIIMIEFETPKSLEQKDSDPVAARWGNAFTNFIDKLIGGL